MKQYITQKQWNELTHKQAELLVKWQGDRSYWNPEIDKILATINKEMTTISIGQMMEFLGDDLASIEHIDDDYYVNIGRPEQYETSVDKEPINALWKAVKKKLNGK